MLNLNQIKVLKGLIKENNLYNMLQITRGKRENVLLRNQEKMLVVSFATNQNTLRKKIAQTTMCGWQIMICVMDFVRRSFIDCSIYS